MLPSDEADIKPYLLITVPLVLEKIFKGKVMPTLQKPALRVLTAIPGVRNLIYKKVREKLLTTFGGNLRSIVLGGAALNPAVEKVMKAVTDSGPTEPNSPISEPIQNIFTIMEAVSTPDTIEYFKEKYASCEIRYGDLKKQLAEDIISAVAPIFAIAARRSSSE